MKLYYAAGTCALASNIALEEAGAKFETVRVDFRSNEQRKPEYLAINPKGRVPALVTEHGVLTETPALLIYIAQAFPRAGLAPLGDAFALARVQAFKLPVLDRACGARPPHARLPLGGRSRGDRGHAAQGAAVGGRVLRADRA